MGVDTRSLATVCAVLLVQWLPLSTPFQVGSLARFQPEVCHTGRCPVPASPYPARCLGPSTTRLSATSEDIDPLSSSAPPKPTEDKRARGIWKVLSAATSAFPVWVLAASLLGVHRPATLTWFTGDLITWALAGCMVSMGMTLKISDFADILKHPKAVAVGVGLQYSVMPLMGWMVSRIFRLSPALAAGVILVGCSPGGTASNLVTLLAEGDVALSVLLTSASTLLATVMTPLLTQALVGSLVDINGGQLILSTAQVVFAPVAIGLALNTFARDLTEKASKATPLLCVILVALICGAASARNSAALLSSGWSLVGALVSMHVGGFALGFLAPRLLGLPLRTARTTSIEVGMQNSALAVVLAQRAFPDPLSALPGAVSATCHSILGSSLAALWRYTDRRQSGRKGQRSV